jgi:hypothetical protein
MPRDQRTIAPGFSLGCSRNEKQQQSYPLLGSERSFELPLSFFESLFLFFNLEVCDPSFELCLVHLEDLLDGSMKMLSELKKEIELWVAL